MTKKPDASTVSENSKRDKVRYVRFEVAFQRLGDDWKCRRLYVNIIYSPKGSMIYDKTCMLAESSATPVEICKSWWSIQAPVHMSWRSAQFRLMRAGAPVSNQKELVLSSVPIQKELLISSFHMSLNWFTSSRSRNWYGAITLLAPTDSLSFLILYTFRRSAVAYSRVDAQSKMNITSEKFLIVEWTDLNCTEYASSRVLGIDTNTCDLLK